MARRPSAASPSCAVPNVRSMGAATINIRVAEAGPLVRDVMLAAPDTMPPTATVADARERFESPRHKLLLVADGSRYVGAITRESIEGADDGAPLGSVAYAEVPTLAPDDPAERTLELDRSRTPVVDAGGDLVGLVCFNRSGQTYCVLA